MRIFLILGIYLSSILVYASNDVKISDPPAWVTKINLHEAAVLDGVNDIYYLLVDKQVNLIDPSEFSHFAMKVLNSSGIQSVSDITVEFDPGYQELTFHGIRIIRDGQIIDKLTGAGINVFQRETQLERFIYDGSLTASINLTDVRKNDIIEYSYTIKGFNPLNQGHYSSSFYQEYGIPVSKIFNRIIADPRKDIQIRQFNGADEPVISNDNRRKEYSWTLSEVAALKAEDNLPAWFYPFSFVAFTTFKSWEEVVEWAMPLYSYDRDKVKREIKLCEESESLESEVLCLIRAVQDEIRYLALASGMSAYKPNEPTRVFHQKYGDCKDKSLLLVALLNNKGLEAYPLLVSSHSGHALPEKLPGFSVFNHCVVYFKLKNREYFVDPTISNQGGDLDNMVFPNYEYGLLIKPGQHALLSIPDRYRSSISVSEIINVKSIRGEASYFIETEYKGQAADNMRQIYNSYTIDYLQKENLDYYSHMYSGIEARQDFFYEDDLRNSTNVFITQENYLLKDYWMAPADSSYWYFEVYPLMIESYIDYPKSAGRTMPYYIGGQLSFSNYTKIILPENWPISIPPFQVQGEGFTYSDFVSVSGNEVVVRHAYERNKEFISPESTFEFLRKHDDIKKQLSLNLSHTDGISGFRLSWAAIIITLITLGAGAYFANRLYTEYDPDPLSVATPLSIGGWLILPAIGLTVSPFILIYQLISTGYYNQNDLLSIIQSGSEYTFELLILFTFILISNLLIIVYTILVAILFFKRRTSVPRLITYLYGINLAFLLLILVIYHTILPVEIASAGSGITERDIFQAILGAAIWIPYFMRSKRVKETFCIRYANKNVQVPVEGLPRI
jgi:hypothetical protein